MLGHGQNRRMHIFMAKNDPLDICQSKYFPNKQYLLSKSLLLFQPSHLSVYVSDHASIHVQWRASQTALLAVYEVN